MRKLKGRDAILADHVQDAIDEGKDISETEISRDRRQKPHTYRKTVPFTHDEALLVAIQVLEAHFIEVPLFINSAVADFTQSALGIPDQKPAIQVVGNDEPELVIERAQGEPKDLEVELQPETRLTGEDRIPLSLQPIALARINEEKENLRRLLEMVDFDEETPNGNA